MDSDDEREQSEELGDREEGDKGWNDRVERSDDVVMERPDRLEWRRSSRLELMVSGAADRYCGGWTRLSTSPAPHRQQIALTRQHTLLAGVARLQVKDIVSIS